MKLGESTQHFASPEAALAHYGRKGMKWGVRKEEELSGERPHGVEKPKGKPAQTEAEKIAAKRARAKKVIIGVGVLTAVAGAGFVAYKLNQSGSLPISSVKKTASPKTEEAVKKILSEPTSIIHSSRGKNKGFRFFQQGGTPDYFQLWDSAFGGSSGGAATSGVFKHLPGGHIAASFLDPEGRKDFSGRTIPHEVIIPKFMTDGIDGLDDVVQKIWPLLKDTYLYD